MKKIIFSLLLLFAAGSLFAQINLDYQKPPKEILDLVDVPRAPSVVMNTDGDTMLLLFRDSYKTIATLSEKELRLGGLRINPKTNIGSRTTYFNNVKIKGIDNGPERQVAGLPADAKISNFSWSPDESKMALTNTVATGVEIWVTQFVGLKTTKTSWLK
jgi:hypothetical protein